MARYVGTMVERVSMYLRDTRVARRSGGLTYSEITPGTDNLNELCIPSLV